MVDSLNRETHYGPQNTIILIIGTPKKGTPNFGKPLCVVCCAKEGNLTTELELYGYLQEPLLALPGCRSVSSNATQRKHGKRHASTTVHGHSPFLDYVVCRQPRVAEFSIVILLFLLGQGQVQIMKERFQVPTLLPFQGLEGGVP